MNINNFLQKIKKEKPTPKWIFISKSILFWTMFVLFVFIGVVSISLIIYSLFNSDFNINNTNLELQIKFIFNSLPYVWIIITALFFVVSYLNIRKTENAYKFLSMKNILLALVVTFVLAIVFYNIGFSKFLDKNLQENIPVYKNYMSQHMFDVWNNPDEGLLIGKIKEITTNNQIILDTYDQKEWIINTNENTTIRGRVEISIGSGIKIIGTKTGNNTFEAQEIRPEMGMMMQNNQMMNMMNN